MSDDKQALYNKGLELYGQQKYDEAIEEYKKAIEIDPQDGEIYLAVSMTFDRKQDYENALDYARKAVDFMPREPLAYTNLSRIYQKKGMIAEAEEAMAISKQIASGMM